ncbi:Cleavage and polyadenylation specificity factor subunit 1 [Lamellibrachia satsuma]|nr:Cleavage and polyadenylation specificity factor subunit 1 [Lamellibrachia satsuma]
MRHPGKNGAFYKNETCLKRYAVTLQPTAWVNQLHVYRLTSEAEQTSKEPDKASADTKAKKQKLECLATFALFGNVMSMQSVRLAGSQRDALLLSFKDAKLSLVEYNARTHDLKTSSLHYFEDDELKDGHCQHNCHLPLVRVDPEGRCAAMLVFGTRLVILPFRRETVSDETDNLLGTSKPPVMSSYLIDLHKLDEKITNVLDIQFLHGYYEPTIFILYEPLPTWAGRIAVRKDSCSIAAISLNILQRVHPIIWSLSGLPFDSLQAFPVMKPIGGVLLFAVNSLMYLNQSLPPYGVSLNSITHVSTEFLLKPQEGVMMSLDCAQACFLSSDKLVISLKGGELYLLTLMVDGMRAVRGFHLDKAAASVLTTCMCLCQDGYLFLGSRLGNSLLLKYTEKTPEASDIIKTDPSNIDTVKDKPAEEPPAKKKKTDTLGDWIASDVSTLDDLDELEVYGSDSQQQTGAKITQYTFEVCDSVMNIGPCGQTVMGEPAFLSEEFSNTIDPDIELVTTSGYSKNGAISVLQRSIRPQVVTTFELPGCSDMWTVVGPRKPKKTPEEEEAKVEKDDTNTEEADKDAAAAAEVKEDEADEDSHALLILSREDSSMILKTGQEIMELDHSGFSTQGPTVYAGNIGNNKYIIQVSTMGVRLLDGVTQLQHIPIDVGSPIVSCSAADPYILIKSREGVIMLVTLKTDLFVESPRLIVTRPQLSSQSRVSTFCVYKDMSSLFSTVALENTEPTATVCESTTAPPAAALETTLSSVDDEDELLYGDSGMSKKPEQKEKASESSESSGKLEEVTPTFWAVFAHANGMLEVYSVQEQEFQLCFLVKNFPVGHKVLVDSVQTLDTGSTSGSSDKIQQMASVKELLLVGLGNKKSRPHLMARLEDELLIYEAFPYCASPTDKRLKLHFKKLEHGLILKERRPAKMKKKASETGETGAEKADCVNWLRPFNDICGYSGVFICGPYPHWLFMTARGILRIHPMAIDGMITCMTPFHNVNCPKGFLYFNRQGEMRICVLPTHLSYDAHWSVRKVPLRSSPHFVVYHPESKTYAVVTSVAEPCNKFVKVAVEGEKDFEVLERDERYIYPTIDKFSIQLFSPVSWEPVPNTRFELDDFEHVSCVKNVNLTSEGTVSGLKGFIAVGTSCNYNEDVTSRGRIIIFDIIEVVPEPGQPLTKNKMKVEYDKEQKGPITALDHVHGFLVTAIGQKIYIWQLKNEDLSGVAFIDTQIYIHSIITIKNLILVADLCKSISVLRYQQDMKVLSLVSRDVRALEVYSCAFMVDNNHLCFLVSDRLRNLLIYTYQPEVRESHGGTRLLRRADINTSSHVTTFFRVRCKLSDPSTEKRATGAIEKRHVTYFASLDGSIGFLLPVTEKMYRRLLMVQNALNTHIPHAAGLNPKDYRLVHVETRSLANPHRNILDGDLLWKYLHLSFTERNDLAKRIGTTCEQVVDDLIEVDRTTAHF